MKMGLNSKKSRKYAFAVMMLLAFVAAIGPLSNVCFAVSEYISHRLILSYSAAIVLILTGFLNAYRCCIDAEERNINQAVKIYISVAFAMSGVYYMMHVLHEGCYVFPEDISRSASILDFVYFSFVTVTTVGYGDIVPRHTFVRVLVLLQVLFGLYLIIRISQKPSGN